MGWEVFVLAHVWYEVNILLLPVLVMQGESLHSVDPLLIPGEFNPHWPIIVLYHRSQYSSDDPGDTGGHYEVIYYVPAAGGRTSFFYPDHITYPHLAHLASQGLSSTAQDRARAAMVAYDARNLRVRVWKQDEAVGVSTRTLKRTARRPAHNIVGVVAQVVERTEGHPAYRVLTAHGMINTLLPSNCLVHMTEGNPQVAPIVSDLRSRLAEVQHRETAILKEAFTELTIDAAYEADVARRSAPIVLPRPRVQPSRAQTLEPLAAAAAAASAAQVAKRAKQHMVKIIGERRLEYKVQWSLPEANPVVTWQRKTHLDLRAEYFDLVVAWSRAQIQNLLAQGNAEQAERMDEDQQSVVSA
jgi:hypothetical protein